MECDVLLCFLTVLIPLPFIFFRKELVEADDVERIVIIGVGCKLEGEQKKSYVS